MKHTFTYILVSFVLVACFSSNNAAAQSRTINITRLKCVQTQGDFFSDAIYIKYRINGGDMHRWPSGEDMMFDASDERTSLFRLNCEVGDRVYIELWDHDTFDPDDKLGSTSIAIGSPREGVIEFDEDYQAFYIMNYSISK